MAELGAASRSRGQIKRQISFNNNKSYKSFAWSRRGQVEVLRKDDDDMLQRGDNNNLWHTYRDTRTPAQPHTCASAGKCRETRLQQQQQPEEQTKSAKSEHKNRTIIKMNNDRLIANK